MKNNQAIIVPDKAAKALPGALFLFNGTCFDRKICQNHLSDICITAGRMLLFSKKIHSEEEKYEISAMYRYT